MLDTITHLLCGVAGGYIGALIHDKIKDHREKKCVELPRGILTIDPGKPPAPPPDPPERPR